jgi:hypothetical protein
LDPQRLSDLVVLLQVQLTTASTCQDKLQLQMHLIKLTILMKEI